MFETLIQKLQEDRYLTLETTPQHEPSMHNIIEKIKKFKLQDRVDGFSCTDNPLAKLKYNALFESLKLQMEFKKLQSLLELLDLLQSVNLKFQ